MKKKEYELHITLAQPATLLGWSESKIDGDPQLGTGVRHYLTSYASSKEEAIEKLLDAYRRLAKYKIIDRLKAEEIVFDTRRIGGERLWEESLLKMSGCLPALKSNALDPSPQAS